MLIKMMLRALAFIVMLISSSMGGWQSELDSLLKTDIKATQDSLIAGIVSVNPKWQDVAAYIQHGIFPDMEKGTVILRQTICIDNVQRPWALYVPSSYNPAKRTPLLVILHGAVMRPVIRDDPQKWAADYPFTALAEQQGWLVLYPFGQAGATWWDDVGITNVLSLIKATKTIYNVDDDQVWLGGFSDGGSASYLMAMIEPGDFAAFIALNGDLGIAGQAGNISNYALNLSNSITYAINTTEDDHFPASQIRKEVEFARRAGGNIFYKEYPGPHDFVYKDKEMPLIASFLTRHPRDPFPSYIKWEIADTHFGPCRWLAIDSLTDDKPATWHKDINLIMTDSSIVIGFAPDSLYNGSGIMVGRVVSGNNLVMLLGLRPGDVIININGQAISSGVAFEKYKAKLKRGQDVTMLVKRNGNEMSLNCHLPDPTSYELFRHDRVSGRINAAFLANRIDIESSRVGKFRILVHPDMIRLDQNLTIRLNGKVVLNKIVRPDLAFMLHNFLANRDRKLLFVAQVELP
jgi:hypothetical protein